jgi:inorganic triphosphatase YgiF
VDRYGEVERKFDADPGMPLPDLTGAAGAVSELVESRLDATYFDTAGAQLVRRKVALRRRIGATTPAGT